jgi:beta-glucosidase
MAGRTYRYMANEKILYPFGFGLSYSTFAFSELEVTPNGRTAQVAIRVENTGERSDETVVQFYLHGPDHAENQPQSRLVSFQRIQLAPGEQSLVECTLEEKAFEIFDQAGNRHFAPGNYKLIAAAAAPLECAEKLGAPAPLSRTLEIRG